MAIRNKCYNTCFYLHDRFRIRKLFLVCHDTLRRLAMGGAYPYMDLNARYGKLLLRCLLQWIQIRISAKRGKCTWNSNLQTKCRTEIRFHALKFSDGYKSTMDWCSVYILNTAPHRILISLVKSCKVIFY